MASPRRDRISSPRSHLLAEIASPRRSRPELLHLLAEIASPRRSRPELLHQAPSRLQVLDVLLRRRGAHPPVRGDRRLERAHDVAPHRRPAADVDVRVALQHRPELLGVLGHAVLHVHLLRLRAREGEAQARERAGREVGGELVLVEVVLRRPAAPKVEADVPHPRRPRGAKLAQEGAEGGDAGAGAHHHEGGGRVLRQHEGGGAHEDARGGGRREGGGELRGAHAFLGAALGPSARLSKHLDGQVDVLRVGGGRGGDGVIARRQLGRHLEQGGPARRARRELAEELCQPAPVAADVGEVLGLARGRREVAEALRLGRLAARLSEQPEQRLGRGRA
eukprot:CAMPEP_0119398350 /NCGR_PEP_ID=MMETSP1334-20130426/140800_2 /TAXON_ID=127549 /ORGANISM="Calcidiscus leptoporus, Strain RCC1130" /LENGTH=335 /DNA_ID=CAMNT_0007422209 /DNA_START=299 /DNA_END=1306 /DNA_ORIENTATION=-